MRSWERVVEPRLIEVIYEQQYGFMPGKGTTDIMLVNVDRSIEKVGRNCVVFVDREEAYDSVLREGVCGIQ